MSPDKIIQNYRLIRFIGDGGMGQVWLGEHTLLGRKVAIKSLHPQFARNEAIRARFKQEASTLAHLQHPNIVALHDYIEDGEGAYLVMEFVDGIPLDDYITKRSGPIPTQQLKELFGQILDGFIYAHGKMIVHRDIKPSNFLVTHDGKVKILDFGIAKILNETDRKLTKTGQNMGTVLYMSPEQVRGESVDARSDIYSLGVTLFQMATGQCPYPNDTTEFWVYDQIVNHPLPLAASIYPGVTDDVEGLIRKATQKSAVQRFQSCSEFKQALNVAPAAPVPPSKPKELDKTVVDAPVAVSTPVVQAQQPVSPPATTSSQTKKGVPMGAIVGGLVLVLAVVVLLVWKPWVGAEGDYQSSNTESSNSGADRPAPPKKEAKRESDPAPVEEPIADDGGDVGEGPENTVRNFYQYLGNQDSRSAYDLTEDQPFGDYQGMKSYFGCIDATNVYEAEDQTGYGNTRAVSLRVHITNCDGSANTYSVKLRLRLSGGEWKITKRLK